MHHLETESAFLADLHEKQHHRHVRWEWGPFRRAVCLRGCFGAPDSQRASACEKRSYQSPFVVFLEYLVIVRVDKGHRNHLSAYATQVWAKMQKTADEFSREFRKDCGWMPEQILRGLQKDVDDIQQRFLDGVSMQDQCRQMKKEAMQAAISRQARKECVWEDAWNPPSIPPRDQGRVPARPGEGRVPPKTRQSAVSSRHSSSPGSGATKSQAQASSSC